MLHYNKADVSEGTNVSKASKSRERIMCQFFEINALSINKLSAIVVLVF